MPTYIVKPNRDEDFYVWWSTVVDSPIGWGPRDGDELAARFDRADANGTSARLPLIADDEQPFGWSDPGFILQEQDDLDYGDGWWSLPRANLREFCRRRDAGKPIADLVTFSQIHDSPTSHGDTVPARLARPRDQPNPPSPTWT